MYFYSTTANQIFGLGKRSILRSFRSSILPSQAGRRPGRSPQVLISFQPTQSFYTRFSLHQKSEAGDQDQSKIRLNDQPVEGRLAIRFACKVCQHINTKTMSKTAYHKGVVLIQCDGCKNRHLIADNLGWFRDNRVNIEDLARENGEKVSRLNPDDPLLKGLIEFSPNETLNKPQLLEADKDNPKK